MPCGVATIHGVGKGFDDSDSSRTITRQMRSGGQATADKDGSAEWFRCT